MYEITGETLEILKRLDAVPEEVSSLFVTPGEWQWLRGAIDNCEHGSREFESWSGRWRCPQCNRSGDREEITLTTEEKLRLLKWEMNTLFRETQWIVERRFNRLIDEQPGSDRRAERRSGGLQPGFCPPSS